MRRFWPRIAAAEAALLPPEIGPALHRIAERAEDNDWARIGAIQAAAADLRYPLPLSASDDDICSAATVQADRTARTGNIAFAKARCISYRIDYKGLPRASCELWWRRQLRKTLGRLAEQGIREARAVGKGRARYISDSGFARWRAAKRRTARILSTLAIADGDTEIDLDQIVAHSAGAPIVRRTELMTRIHGVENWAIAHGLSSEFWTLTAPGYMHAESDQYDGSTPREVAAYLGKVWGRIRARCAKIDLKLIGLRVAEPHKDGTPHHHYLVFMPRDQADAAWEIFRASALRESPDEPGAAAHRAKRVQIDHTKGSATGYVAKYIAKAIAADDVKGADDINPEAVDRARAWASTWGIRQFQYFGTAPVTLWRELRRMRGGIAAGPMAAAWTAADLGDWCGWEEAWRGDQTWATLTRETEMRYGDKAKRVIGVRVQAVSLVTREREWTIRRKKTSEQKIIEEEMGTWHRRHCS